MKFFPNKKIAAAFFRRCVVAVAFLTLSFAADCTNASSERGRTTSASVVASDSTEKTPSSAVAFAPRIPGKKKLIEFGWDIPTTDYFRRNWEKMEENAPFDGVVYELTSKSSVDGAPCSSQELFTKTPWNRADFDVCVADLKSCDFKRFRNNFIRINFYPFDFGWSDEAAWEIVCDKARICAEIARETDGGLCFDFESYVRRPFLFDPTGGLSFAEAKALARKRGAQFGGAVFDEFPNVVILAVWLNSINYAAGRSANPDLALRNGEYGLLPAFIDGLLDVAPPEVLLVDGCENGYYMRNVREYERAALDALLANGPGVALVAPENREKYRSQVQIGFGFYLDMYSNPPEDAHYIGPEGDATRFDRLVANLKGAFDSADEYVWIYGEHKRWWPADSEASADAAQKTPSWEEALPGITDAILELSAPDESLAKEKAALEADPNVRNLVENADFSDSSGSGRFAGWTVEFRENASGESATVDGKAALRGAEDGRFVQAIAPVRTGERYFVSVAARATGSASPTLTVRWQDGAGYWTEVICDARLYAKPDAVPDADGRIEISGRVVVPIGTGKLILELGSKGAGPNDVVVFDKAVVYRRQDAPKKTAFVDEKNEF